MPFFVASANAGGALIASSSEQLTPGPATVDYPTDPAGSIHDTAGGSKVKQTPPADPRLRAWQWETLPTYRPGYINLIRRLEGLLGSTRQARGLSPWVYLKDTESDEFRIWHLQQYPVTGAGPTTVTAGAAAWPVNGLTGAVVEILSGTAQGQRQSIVSNTATQLTVNSWGSQPDTTSVLSVQWGEPTFLRCRVLNVSKKPVAKRSLTYETVRVEFIIDDSTWNALG